MANMEAWARRRDGRPNYSFAARKAESIARLRVKPRGPVVAPICIQAVFDDIRLKSEFIQWHDHIDLKATATAGNCCGKLIGVWRE
jgi:hypothetical protein